MFHGPIHLTRREARRASTMSVLDRFRPLWVGNARLCGSGTI